MKEPRHLIKCRIVAKKSSYWRNFYKDGFLGSNVFDRNGVEICEGDRVKFSGDAQTYTAVFENGAFWLNNQLIADIKRTHELEVVGHITEEANNDNRT